MALFGLFGVPCAKVDTQFISCFINAHIICVRLHARVCVSTCIFAYVFVCALLDYASCTEDGGELDLNV